MPKMILLDFTADWCGTCKVVDTIVEREILPKIKDKMDFKKIDVEKNRELIERYNILSVPTLVLVSGEGKELWRKSGRINPEELMKQIEEDVKKLEQSFQ